MDVQNFFTSIDLDILYRIIERHMDNSLYLWLSRVTIFHRATKHGAFVLTSPKSLWRMLPAYKSMFNAKDNVGLAIGNLTSQHYANVYMNRFDQYVAHHLKGRYLYWQRYVDDVVFVSDDPAHLRSLIPLVRDFLATELRLTINPKKTLLQPLSRGLDHLGYFFRPTHTEVRRRVRNNCWRKVEEIAALPETAIDANAVCSSINSYLGHFGYAASRRQRELVTERIAATPKLAASIDRDECNTKLLPAKALKEERDRAARAKEIDLRTEFSQAFTEPNGTTKRRSRLYLKQWRPMADLLEAAERAHGGLPPTTMLSRHPTSARDAGPAT